MIRDALLGLGLLLSTASQLRLPGVPLGLGPGEFLMAIWMLLALTEAMIRPARPLPSAFSRLLIFWTVFAFALSVGTIVGLAIEEYHDTAAATRTAKAYVFVALVSCLVVVQPDTARRLHRITWFTVAGGAFFTTVMLAGAHGFLRVPGLEFWVFRRFIGWSNNPNQFALLCTVLMHLSLHLVETSARPGARYVALLCAAPVFVAGLLTRSDSFVLAMLVVGPALIGIKFWNRVFVAERRLSLGTAFACLMIISIPAVLVATAPFTPKLVEKAHGFAVETMENNDQAEGRFELWREAMTVGLRSGLLGLGPGPHLDTKQWKLPPPEKNEAHNTMFDLFTQGGLLAVLGFFWISATAFAVSYRNRFVGLTTLVVSLFVFSNFHLIVRHPIFWFSVALCLATADVLRWESTKRAGVQWDGTHRPFPPFHA